MMQNLNDNAVDGPKSSDCEPDAHGQAALLLAESMLHSLIEASALTGRQAIEAVQTACAVKTEQAELSMESDGRPRESLVLLEKIASSLAIDEC